MGADMKIEAGKYYRTRGGDVVGPIVQSSDKRYPWTVFGGTYSSLRWTQEGDYSYTGPNFLDLISEIYVSDTPPADAPAATPSDDTVVTFNFSQMARDGRKWATGSIGFWIGDEMRTAHYDVRIGGVEGKAWPSDVPNPWRDNRGLPAPAPEAKTLRDELVEKAALEIFKRFYLTPEGRVGFDWMWRAAENFVEARKK